MIIKYSIETGRYTGSKSGMDVKSSDNYVSGAEVATGMYGVRNAELVAL